MQLVETYGKDFKLLDREYVLEWCVKRLEAHNAQRQDQKLHPPSTFFEGPGVGISTSFSQTQIVNRTKSCVFCGRFPFFTVGDSFFFLQLRVSLGENEPLLFSSTRSATHAGTALTNVSHYFTKSMHPPQHV